MWGTVNSVFGGETSAQSVSRRCAPRMLKVDHFAHHSRYFPWENRDHFAQSSHRSERYNPGMTEVHPVVYAGYDGGTPCGICRV